MVSTSVKVLILMACTCQVMSRLQSLVGDRGSSLRSEERIPSYMALRLTDFSVEFMSSTIIESFFTTLKQYKDDDKLKDDITAFTDPKLQLDNWKIVQDPHITQLFLGGNEPTDPIQLEQYKNYKEDVLVSVGYMAFAYIPRTLTALVADVNRKEVYSANRFCHTTLATRDLSAQYSNQMLESLYDQNEKYKQDYDTKFRNAGKVSRYSIEFEGSQYTAYVIAIPYIKRDSYTHSYY